MPEKDSNKLTVSVSLVGTVSTVCLTYSSDDLLSK